MSPVRSQPTELLLHEVHVHTDTDDDSRSMATSMPHGKRGLAVQTVSNGWVMSIPEFQNRTRDNSFHRRATGRRGWHESKPK